MSWLTRLTAWFIQLSALWRYAIISVVGIGAIVLIMLLWIVVGPGPMDFVSGTRVALADYKGTNPTGVPAELAGASVIQRGEYLARAADCKACHTAKGGAPFAGGLAFATPFGTLYSLNITADKETGIGNWTDEAFLGAIHKGVDDEGVPLYPAMPYASYTQMSDADALAIKAYLFSLAPVPNEVPPNRINFPFNQRWLLSFWSLFFNSDARFSPNTGQSPEWNRGAYLAEALAHCGECHTPRNLMQGLNHARKFTGATQAGWTAYNITSDKASGVGAWSDADVAAYLATGHAAGHGTAGGPMGEAVDNSFVFLTQTDIAAMVTYLRSVPAQTTAGLPDVKTALAPASHRDGVTSQLGPRGKEIFAGACASCHGWTGSSPLTPFATLTGVRAVSDSSAINVVQVILNGERRATPRGEIFMPAFGHAYSDEEVAAVANYVTARFGSSPSNVTAAEVARMRGQTSR